MLKLVEEPPSHVKFIFATTEPERSSGDSLPDSHYPFRLVPPKVLVEYLAELCGKESRRRPRRPAAGGACRWWSRCRLAFRCLTSFSAVLLQWPVGGRHGPPRLHPRGPSKTEIVDAFAAGTPTRFATIDKVIEVGQDPRRFAEDLLPSHARPRHHLGGP